MEVKRKNRLYYLMYTKKKTFYTDTRGRKMYKKKKHFIQIFGAEKWNIIKMQRG